MCRTKDCRWSPDIFPCNAEPRSAAPHTWHAAGPDVVTTGNVCSCGRALIPFNVSTAGSAADVALRETAYLRPGEVFPASAPAEEDCSDAAAAGQDSGTWPHRTGTCDGLGCCPPSDRPPPAESPSVEQAHSSEHDPGLSVWRRWESGRAAVACVLGGQPAQPSNKLSLGTWLLHRAAVAASGMQHSRCRYGRGLLLAGAAACQPGYSRPARRSVEQRVPRLGGHGRDRLR